MRKTSLNYRGSWSSDGSQVQKTLVHNDNRSEHRMHSPDMIKKSILKCRGSETNGHIVCELSH